MNYSEDLIFSRFFRITDDASYHIVFDLPTHWWSRPYEYAWASQFAWKNDIILDAACGLCHPFKFHLRDICNQVYACDFDKRINNQELLIEDIQREFSASVVRNIPSNYLNGIQYKCANITSLPYRNHYFNKVFCISVLEHLNDDLNISDKLDKDWTSRFLKQRDIIKALKEFRRILFKEGLVILTFDFPTINLSYLQKAIDEAGLMFAGKVDFKLPTDAIFSIENNIYCFRAVLKAKQ